jgi:hypothetical protein
MKLRGSSGAARRLALAGALGGLAVAGLAPASCTLDAAGTASTPPGGGAAGPGAGGGGGEPATTSSGGGSGAHGSEDCLDGIDNDHDGAVDCADGDCDPGYECVDAPADGWTGYARVQQVAYPAGTLPEACPGGSAPAVYYAGETGPAECVACSCTFSGATCTAPQLKCHYGNPGCTGPATLVAQLSDGNCVDDPSTPSSGFGSCILGLPAAVVGPGTCSSSGGDNTNPSPWETEIRVCTSAAGGGGCGAGEACAPRSPTGFDGAVCMTKAGNDGCPGGWTYVDLQGYDQFTDSRACSPCGCDVSSITCSGGKYTLYDGDSCTDGADGHIDVGITCLDASSYLDVSTFSYRAQPGTPSPAGTCATTGPTGTLAKSGATTICCKQP